MSIGVRIATKRQENNWSQTHLAKLIGINVKSVKDWENGVSLPSAKTLIRLSEVFGVSTDYLLGINQKEIVSLENLSSADRIRVRAFIQMLLDLRLN